MVKYNYDAWGNCKVLNANGVEITDSNNIGILNPFRYRSYYYDTETKLYFLKTRYYDPEVGRFITIDDLSYLDPDSINGLNLYAYCKNNPVMYVDQNGCAPKWLTWVAIGAIAIATIAICIATFGAATPVLIATGTGLFIGMGASALGQYISNDYSWQNFSFKMMLYDGIIGAVNGALAATGISICLGMFAGAIIGGLSSIGSDMLFNEGDIQLDSLIFNTILGIAAGRISGPGAKSTITKLTHSQKILSSTIKNNTLRAIPNQTLVRNKHLINLIL